jgi:hypothetical protein
MDTYRAIRPGSDEYAPFYAGYVAGVPDGDVLATLAQTGAGASDLLADVPEATAERAYAAGKWTLKEVVQHCSDAERIFAYRALRIGRGDATDLPGWDEQAYAPASRANARGLQSLVEELRTARAGTISLLDGLPSDAWILRGRANGMEVSVRGIAWITVGHLMHHLRIVQERYLNG